MSEASTLALKPADFSVNERTGEYTARFAVSGTITIEIKADSLADAKAKADCEADKMREDSFVEIDDIDTIEVDHVYKNPPMYRVLRDGKNFQVSRLEPGDIPREPDEHGF